MIDRKYPSWCVIWCAPDSCDPRMTSGYATKEIAILGAGHLIGDGYQILMIAEASEILAIQNA